jgi:hypothetical protein
MTRLLMQGVLLATVLLCCYLPITVLFIQTQNMSHKWTPLIYVNI